MDGCCRGSNFDTKSASTVLVHQHGSGSSRLELTSRDEDFAALKVRVLAPERPGYGESSPLNDAWSMIDWAKDVAALVDEIGVETFAVVRLFGRRTVRARTRGIVSSGVHACLRCCYERP